MEDTLRDKISAYLNGQLPDQERDAFQAEIQKNDYLAAQVDLMRLEITMLDVVHEDWIRGKMKEWESAYPEESPKANFKRGLFRKNGVILRFLAETSLIIALCLYYKNHHEIPVASSFGDPVWLAYVFSDYDKHTQSPSGKGPYNFTRVKGDTTVAIITKKPPPLPSYLTYLDRIIDGQRGNLSRLGNSNDWRYYLVSHEYDKAWELLREIVKTKEDINRKPDAFYYSALLKLYWNPAIEANATEILNQLTYSGLSSVIPGFKEEELNRHRAFARKTDDLFPMKNSLIRRDTN